MYCMHVLREFLTAPRIHGSLKRVLEVPPRYLGLILPLEALRFPVTRWLGIRADLAGLATRTSFLEWRLS